MTIEGTLAAAGFGAAGWIMSSLLRNLLSRVQYYFQDSGVDMVHRLQTYIIPRLKLTLEAAESSEHKVFFEAMVWELKSDFYKLREVLEKAEYHRLENQHKQGLAIGSSGKLPASVRYRLNKIILKIEETIQKTYGTIWLEKLPFSEKSISELRPNIKEEQEPTFVHPRGRVIGLDEQGNKITEVLHITKDYVNRPPSKRSYFSVIGICGIAGSGKTTLARHVYESEKKGKHFELFMWIHLSQNFSWGDIISDMLEQASGTGDSCPRGNSLEVLRETLKEHLRDKKFLLVLDDIWCEEKSYRQKLSELLSPFEDGHAGSKILVTSRNKNAMFSLGPDVDSTAIEIQELSEKDFFDLFMHYALGGEMIDSTVGENFLEIGAHIAERLMRSPLAATIVGGLLRKDRTIDHWRSVRDDPCLLREVTGFLWSSYQNLNEGARRCFAYCSIFPRWYLLERDELVKLWVAEGLIDATNATQMEDTAMKIFGELVSTSFLLLRDKDPNGGKERFIVHYLLYDIAEQVAGCDYFKIIYGKRERIPLDVRHLFVETNDGSEIWDIFKLKKLCTLIIHTDSRNSTKILEKIFEKKRLRKLRVLIFKTRGRRRDGFEFPASIGHFKHLCYLAVWTSWISLPDSFTKLYHLQVLDFGKCNSLLFSYPGGMTKLTNLRHLMMKGPFNVPNIRTLILLQTLSSFTIKSDEPGYEFHQLSHLNKLRGKLKILNLEDAKSEYEAHDAHLADKDGLRKLVLVWGFGRPGQQVLENIQADVLEALRPPKCLEELEIQGYNGERYPHWMIGGSHCLVGVRKLALQSCRPLGAIPQTYFFVNLLKLAFYKCTWGALPDNMEHLLQLEALYIDECINIWSFGEGELPSSLKYIYIRKCDQDFMESCNIPGNPNWEKIQPIAKKYIPYLSRQDLEYLHGFMEEDNMEEDGTGEYNMDGAEQETEEGVAEDNENCAGQDTEDSVAKDSEIGVAEDIENVTGQDTEDGVAIDSEICVAEDNENGAGQNNEDGVAA